MQNRWAVLSVTFSCKRLPAFAALLQVHGQAACIASAISSGSYGLTISASVSSSAAPAKRDRISTPGSSGSWAATYSLATRFMPSRSGVTRPTRATR